jgi:ribonuclease G
MNKIYIDGLSGRIRTALKEDGELTEIIYESESDFHIGNIYIGRVAKVLKGQFIFINIGDEKNAFLQPDKLKEPSIYSVDGKIKLKEGDSIAVQLIKSAVDEKGAVVTTRLNFTGKYCVVIANDSGVGVSSKIKDKVKRDELKALAEEYLPKDFAVIMRTDCELATLSEISSELKSLVALAQQSLKRADNIKPPKLLYEELSETSRIVRDLAVGKEVDVITNCQSIADKLKDELKLENIILYDEPVPLFHSFGIESAISEALHKKVWLKSGGYLVIDYTEAMNVIDVNSGKHTGKNIKNFALKVNLEAAETIAKQIRLRNLSGMIIIDFIDMKTQEEIDKVGARLKECIARDRVTTSLVGMTSLGLMQITRKKTGLPLHKILMHPCHACIGTAMVENEFYISYKVINEVIALLSQTIYKHITIKCDKRLFNALQKNKALINELEQKYNGTVVLNEIETGRQNYYKLEKFV